MNQQSELLMVSTNYEFRSKGLMLPVFYIIIRTLNKSGVHININHNSQILTFLTEEEVK